MTTGEAVSEPPFRYPSPEGAECPYPFYAWMHANCPVYHLPSIPDDSVDPGTLDGDGRPVLLPGTKNMYFVSRDEDIRHVTKHTEIFSSTGRAIGAEVPTAPPTTATGVKVQTMIESDPPESAVHRRYARAPFTPRAIRQHEPMVRAHVTRLIDAFIDDGRCDFVGQFATPLPTFVTCDLMGFPYELYEDVKKWNQIEASGIVFLPEDRRDEQMQIAMELLEYVDRSVDERAEQPRDDALSDLIRAQIERDGEFCKEYVCTQAISLIAGGVITSAHMMGMTMLLLLQHPETMAEVRGDHSLIGPMLEEALRLESPVQWVPRRVVQDTELGGVSIPEGSWVLLGWGAANRDPSHYEAVESFDIHRDDIEHHLAFGNGAHFCLGAPLARLEGTVAFEELFTRLADIRLAPDQEIVHVDSPSFRGLRSLEIHFDTA